MRTSRSGKVPIVIITIGHPTGIGPEVTLKALSDKKIASAGKFLLVGDRMPIESILRRLGMRVPYWVIDGEDFNKRSLRPGTVLLLDTGNMPRRPLPYGSGDPAFGKPSVEYVSKAVKLLRSGIGDALVTAPIHKASAGKAGFRFAGHTEYLAHLTKTKKFAMMLIGGMLKVTLVTRHVPLKEVSAAISEKAVREAIEMTHDTLLKKFKIRSPRIGVAGLNPHAGEGGMLGKEERAIEKAIAGSSRKIGNLIGPRPPDVIFHEAYSGQYDAVVAMYHDQGLIPLKMLYFKTGVNLTLGLPFIRTSPDHGTALEIAGRGIADPDSMKEAIKLACSLAGSRTCS
ncbi:4-hydroxythreonine-4-phosphate dehydrogenase PdxA [Candidatus Omnitrophota bacterium]